MDEPTELSIKRKRIFCGSNSIFHIIGTNDTCHNGICNDCLGNLSKVVAGTTSYQRDVFVETLLKTSAWEKARKKIIKDAVADVAKEMMKARRR